MKRRNIHMLNCKCFINYSILANEIARHIVIRKQLRNIRTRIIKIKYINEFIRWKCKEPVL